MDEHACAVNVHSRPGNANPVVIPAPAPSRLPSSFAATVANDKFEVLRLYQPYAMQFNSPHLGAHDARCRPRSTKNDPSVYSSTRLSRRRWREYISHPISWTPYYQLHGLTKRICRTKPQGTYAVLLVQPRVRPAYPCSPLNERARISTHNVRTEERKERDKHATARAHSSRGYGYREMSLWIRIFVPCRVARLTHTSTSSEIVQPYPQQKPANRPTHARVFTCSALADKLYIKTDARLKITTVFDTDGGQVILKTHTSGQRTTASGCETSAVADCAYLQVSRHGAQLRLRERDTGGARARLVCVSETDHADVADLCHSVWHFPTFESLLPHPAHANRDALSVANSSNESFNAVVWATISPACKSTNSPSST
ncbi:hypothetical protein C8R45DRAFT_1189203 [Mycena sanguinolenta]|nr:hypothetical protein C8R45DRAFT_1189203 [Mycena sanguinolenta]